MSEATQEQMQKPKHGTFCWTEIATSNLEESVKFYRELFGWKITKSQNDDIKMDYREFDTGLGHPSGGMYEMTTEMFGNEIPPPHFINYVSVDDVDESAKRVTELGGKILVEPHDIPKTGRMIVVQDPTGATLALITLKTE
jgi:predicted enzyme related to lactoylglutathione lyase